jgi:hypothetical protein
VELERKWVDARYIGSGWSQNDVLNAMWTGFDIRNADHGSLAGQFWREQNMVILQCCHKIADALFLFRSGKLCGA